MDDIHSIQLHESYDIYHQRRLPYKNLTCESHFLSAIFYLYYWYRFFNSFTTHSSYFYECYLYLYYWYLPIDRSTPLRPVALIWRRMGMSMMRMDKIIFFLGKKSSFWHEQKNRKSLLFRVVHKSCTPLSNILIFKNMNVLPPPPSIWSNLGIINCRKRA